MAIQLPEDMKLVKKLPLARIEEIDRLVLDDRGLLRVLPAETLRAIPELQSWAHFRAIYGFPTAELIDFLRVEIAGLPAVEIGAGNGSIGRALGIPVTDSKLQEREDMALWYATFMQPTIVYPPDIVKLDALAAVARYRPRVVVASWVTQYGADGRHSNSWGVDERRLIKQVRKYVFVGNANVHRHKEIMALPHRELAPPWLVSRAQDQSLNRIWIWKSWR